ncbi:HNH homing endonuclease 2 [Bacillus phage vB_BceH_LY2]|nr:HNH homing endonuclease 2 [Bacillus phage vB_BceH_LY2]
MRSKKEERIGQVVVSKEGYRMVCKDYVNANRVLVSFENGCESWVPWSRFAQGGIPNPYHPSVCGTGYTGKGKYTVRDEEGDICKAYTTWSSMLHRCYYTHSSFIKPSYKNCYVDEKWHNYQNFAEWFYTNYYEIEGEVMHLDKDILVKNNNVYSADTCIFAPKRVNACFIKTPKRGTYPIGVSKLGKKFKSQLHINGKVTHIGCFSTVEEAFNSYKKEKEKYIKNVAEEYKDKIPHILYTAMFNYKVTLDD